MNYSIETNNSDAGKHERQLTHNVLLCNLLNADDLCGYHLYASIDYFPKTKNVSTSTRINIFDCRFTQQEVHRVDFKWRKVQLNYDITFTKNLFDDGQK